MRQKRYLIAAIICFLVVLFCVSQLRGEDKEPFAFSMLRYQFSMEAWADFTITTVMVYSGHARELNPVMRLYVDHPAVSVALFTVGDFTIQWGLSKLWKANKSWAWVVLGVLTAARAYVLINNLRQMR